MEVYQRNSMKRIRRHSHSVLQDLIKGFQDEGRGPHGRKNGPGGERAVTPTHHRSLGNIVAHKGNPIHVTGNNAVGIYKTSKPRQSIIRQGLSDIYLPSISGKMSNLQAARSKLSHSCPYLFTSRRRGSTSSIISQRAPDFSKQSYLKAHKESKKSNVSVTMMYLGQGLPGSAPDEMKVLQQICGGENICVFKGFVQTGEQFQFISQRHLGFPFSASIFVNGMMAARISSCCEYRYAPGFQQGRGSCFRLTRLNGGKPCYKCVNSRHGIGFPAINNPSPTLQRGIHSNEGEESCSSPLFLPLGMERTVQKTRRISKEGSVLSTDSEDMNGRVKERQRPKRHKGQRSRQADTKGSEEGSQPHKDPNKPEVEPASSIKQQPQRLEIKHVEDKNNFIAENKTIVPDGTFKTCVSQDSLQEGKTLNKHNGEKQTDPWTSNGKSSSRGKLRDFYEECVELSTGLESGLDQQRWFKANKIERNRIKDQLTSGPSALRSASEVELSEESDSGNNHPQARKPQRNNKKGPEDESTGKEPDLLKQMDAMTEVLNNSDEVEQLILRNTGLTDDLLESLAAALKRSPSEVTVINLNLNHIGPPGVRVLLDLLHAKPQIKELLLFGNQLGDLGVQKLLSGLADLQDRTGTLRGNSEHFSFSAVTVAIKELDLGGNGIGSDALKVLATFMRYHSRLLYLGLAQTFCPDMEAWMVFFEGLKVNAELLHVILDECNLGDHGVKMFAESLRLNESLRKVDLDNNGFGDAGANGLLDALTSRVKCPLEDLNMDGNYVSTTLMSKIQKELESSRSAPV